MNLSSYQRTKQERALEEECFRECCSRCRKPRSTCYCGEIVPFHSDPEFVILIHRDEARRAVASGRMVHLCLKNSRLFEGTDFSEHEGVNQILNDPLVFPLVLYPSPGAMSLNECSFVPSDKRLVIFVFDATWAKARKMRRLSHNLQSVKTLSIAPEHPSSFRVRKQPRKECLSTLEAIYHVINVLNPDAHRPHDNLLKVFQSMVHTQIAYEEKSGRRTVRGLRKSR